MTTIEDYYNWKKSEINNDDNKPSASSLVDDYYQWKTDVLDKAVAVEEKPPILSPEDEIRQQAREALFGTEPYPMQKKGVQRADKPIGFIESVKEEYTRPSKGAQYIPFIGGVVGTAENLSYLAAAERLKNNYDYSKPIHPERMTPGAAGIFPPSYTTKEKDIKLIEDLLLRTQKQQERGYSFGGKVAKGVMILPTWMIEFALTGGLAQLGNKAAQEAGEKLLKNYAKTKTGQIALKTAGWMGGAITRTSLGLTPRVAEEATRRQVDVQVLGMEPENWATSVAKGWGSVFVEAASEEAGATITKGMAGAIRKMPFGSKFLNAMHQVWTKLSPDNTTMKFWQNVFTKAGYSNYIGEIGEERLATIMHAIAGTEDFGVGKDSNIIQRLQAGINQDINNFPVEATVLSVPGAVRFGLQRMDSKAPSVEYEEHTAEDRSITWKTKSGSTLLFRPFRDGVAITMIESSQKGEGSRMLLDLVRRYGKVYTGEGKYSLLSLPFLNMLKNMEQRGEINLERTDIEAGINYAYPFYRTTPRGKKKKMLYVPGMSAQYHYGITLAQAQKTKTQLSKNKVFGRREDEFIRQSAENIQSQAKSPEKMGIREIAAGQAEMSEEDMLKVMRQEKIPEKPVETRTEEKVAVTPTQEEIKQTAKEEQREKPTAKKPQYTSTPKEWLGENDLYDWGQKGLRSKGNVKIGNRKTFVWQSEYDKIPVRLPKATMDALREKTDEVFKVHVRKGDDYYLAPKQVVNEVQKDLGVKAFRQRPKLERSPLQRINDDINRAKKHGLDDAEIGAVIEGRAKEEGLTNEQLSANMKRYIEVLKNDPEAENLRKSYDAGVEQAVRPTEEEIEERLGIQEQGLTEDIGDFLDGIVETKTYPKGTQFRLTKGLTKAQKQHEGKVGTYIKTEDGLIGVRFDDGVERYLYPDQVEIAKKEDKRDVDLLGREELKGGMAGKTGEMFDKEKFITQKEKDRINAKGDVEGQKKLFEEKPKKKGGVKAIGDVASGGGIDTGRIKVEMERPSKKPQTAVEIINYMERAFDIPIRGVATHKKKYAGWFAPDAVGIRMKDVRSLTTGMHEIGHHIDWTLNNRLSKNPPNKEMRKELMKLGKDLYGQTKPPGGYKSEGWAEFMREYLTGEQAKEKAPAVYKWFTEEYLPKHKGVKAKLAKIKEMITEWRMQGAEARIESQISKKDFKGGLIERFERAALWLDKKWRDELAPIRFSMAKVGIEQDQPAPGENPYQIAVARADKAGAVTSHFVLEYTTDLAGNRTGKGLREILAPVAKDIDKFTRWIVSARARYLHRKGINPGISLADANYVYRLYDSSKWQTVLKEVTEWNHRLLDYLTEAGGLDKEAKKRIIESNPIYIPFMRAFKQGEIRFSGKGTGKGVAKTSKAIKKIKGSGREIIDPIESMINQAYKIISISHKTQVAKSLAMLAEKKGTASMIWRVPAPTQATQFEAEQLKKDIIRIAHEKMGVDPGEISSSMLEHWDELLTVYSNASHYYGKDNIVSLVIDGKRRFYEVDPMLYRAIEGLDQYTLPWAFLAKPARMVRLGATGLNPSFGLIRNFLRDALTFTVLSKHAKAGPVSAAKGVMEDISKTPGAQKFKALGGKMSSQILADRRALQHLKSHVLASNLKGKTVYHVSHPIDALRELFGVTEAGTRIGEFIPALKSAEKKYGEGSVDAAIYALNQAQDVTTNFSRHGEIGKVLNQMIPFYNAAIQGPDKIVRTFRARPTETTLKAIAALTVPAIWLWWRHKDDEWYKNMAIWERINYLHFQIPDTDTIIRIPVPFELGHIFQSAPVAFLDSWDKEDPKLVNEMFEESVRQANPFDWPAVISPVVDILANEDFAGRPIVPMGAEYKLPKDQYKKYTTELMKIIGETINYSPAKIEHLVNSYSGGLYLRVAKTIDLKNKKDIAFKDMPVLTTLFLRDSFAPRAQINRFYERRDFLNQKYSSDKTSLSPEEKRQRKKYNSASTKLKDYWKDLNSADSEYDRAKVYEKMKRELKKAGALGKK